MTLNRTVALVGMMGAGKTAIGKRPGMTVFGNDYDTPDGTCVRDYIHVVDIARAHIAAMERLLHRKSKAPFEIFNLGTGTGAALIVDGHVVPGVHGAAGEIGYLLREPGEPGYAHGHAPLEEYTSGSGLAARGTTLLRRSVTAVDLAADRHEPAIATLLDDAAATIGMTVANLATFLDPERVVVGGGMATAFLPAIESAVTRAVPFPPPVRPGRFIDDAPLIGVVPHLGGASADAAAAHLDIDALLARLNAGASR